MDKTVAGLTEILTDAREGRLTRRELLGRGISLGIGVATMAALADACSPAPAGSSSTPFTLQFQHSAQPDEAHKLFDRYAAEYEQAHPGVKVQVSYVPWADLRTTVLSKLAAHTLPDVLYSSSTAGSAEFKSLNAFIDMGPMMNEQYKDQFISTAFNELGTYGVPVLQSPEGTVFYRKDLFDAAGVKPPPVEAAWTWDQAIEAAKKLTRGDQYGFCERGQSGFTYGKALMPYGFSFGSDLIVKQGDAWKSNLTDPSMRKAITMDVKLTTEHGVRPASYLNWGAPEALRAWTGNQVGMLNIGMWWAGMVEGNSSQKFGQDFAVMLFPVDDQSHRNVSNFFDYLHISRDSKHPEEAFRFISFLMEKDRLLPLVRTNLNLPPSTKSALADPSFGPEQYPIWGQYFSKWQGYSKFMPDNPKYVDLWGTQAVPVVQGMVLGQSTIDAGLDEIDQRITAELAKA